MPASYHTSEYTEKDLLQQIAAGDEQAFSQLFNRYWDHLYNYLMRITKSHEVAEEIVVDVFLKLWTGRELLVNIRNMEAFLFRVAHNKAMDFFKLAARNSRLQKIIEEAMEQPVAPAADYAMLDEEARQVLQEAITRLSPQRRLIFTLSRIEGLSNDEIAERLNLSRHTIKNTLADSVRSILGFLQKNDVSGLVIAWIIIHEHWL